VVASQTDRPGTSQTRAPQGVPYATPELMPQGVVASISPRGAPILVQFTNAQRPLYGTGLTSITRPSVDVLLPGQGPIDRGY
jgi:hypothetical protein